MKKLFFVFVLTLVATASWSQKRVGHYSFIPRVGLNLSNLGDMDIYIGDNPTSENVLKSKSRPDFMLGADVEYQLMEPLGISVGAYYSRQGCRWPDFSFSPIVDEDEKTTTTSSLQDWALTLQYINIPVSAKFYLNDFVAIHAGLQCGIKLDGNMHSVSSDLIEDASGNKTFKSETNDSKFDHLTPLVFSIPVGASIEYENVILDVRYNIPLSRFCNLKYQNDYVWTGRNQVWTLSIGYRL